MTYIVSKTAVEDPRSPVYRMRRHELANVLKANGISPTLPGGSLIPATDMRTRIMQMGIDVTKVYTNKVVENKEVIEKEVMEEAKSYESMKMSEIRGVCKEKGISFTPKDKKADLIGKLNGNAA